MESSTCEVHAKTRDLRKMGCSLLRQCRRRTQSEPPNNYKRDKLRKNQTKSSRSMDALQDHVKVDEFIEKMDTIRNNEVDEEYDKVRLRSSNTTDTIDEGGGGSSVTNNCNNQTQHSKCFDTTAESHYKNFDKYLKNDSDNELKLDNNPCFKANQIENNYSKETYYLNPDMDRRRKNSPSEKLCFTKLMCCRKSRKNSSSNSYKNNNTYPYALEQYLRIPSSSSTASTVDSQNTCVSSLSTVGSSCPTISSSNHSRIFSSENSSANLSHDSGFDEPRCFINMIYENHKCKSYSSCHKKDKASLNVHLRNLMNCMPKSFGSDKEEAIQHAVKGCSGVVHGPPYLQKRRNAICETSEEMRVKFYEALCAFMTLQAMAKYDLL